jgi:poly-gamma-glutamate capsule biosynthesis protein CapA/YwtB (metallophosphatase superfamily)
MADPGPVLDRDVYTGTSLMFNYHPRIISDLQTSGFDILSIANNHSLDRSSVGVDRTIEAFLERQMPYSGAHRTNDPSAPIETVIDRNGFRVAFIACTDVYNGGDPKHLITSCSGDFSRIASTIQRLNQDHTIDAVIITPHWGTEYHHITNGGQRNLAHKFLDAGASAVIGSHPHMLQEVETYVTRDGRDTVIAYSLGNFVSWQGKVPGQKTSMILFVGLTKRPGERAWVNGASYIPLWMDRNPNSINFAQTSKQAPQSIVQNIVSKLMDPSRQIKIGAPLRTDLGCP